MEHRPSQVLDPVLDPALQAEINNIGQQVFAEQPLAQPAELPAPTVVSSTVYGTKGGLHQVGETQYETVDRAAEGKRVLGRAVGAAILGAESYMDPSQRRVIKGLVDRQAAINQALELDRLGREHDDQERQKSKRSK